MRFLSVKRVTFLALLVFLSVFSACAKTDELTSVRDYNNAIIAIQQKMFEDTGSIVSGFGSRSLKVSQALSEVEKVQGIIQNHFENFKKISVPKGAEELSIAMQNFFEVETTNWRLLHGVYRDLNGRENDRKLIDNLSRTLDAMTIQENQALAHFDQVQLEVANKYGEKIEGRS